MSQNALQQTLNKALQVAQQKDINAVFLTRAISALIDITQNSSVIEAASASSNYAVLLSMLETEEAIALLEKEDPLSKARLRGLEIKQKLIEAEGGCISSEKVANLLGISRQAVDKRRKQGKLISISRGKHSYIYPLWQFTDTGKTIKGLEVILAKLKDFDPLMQIAFILDPNEVSLQGKTPLNALRNGDVEAVIRAVEHFGEHGTE